ncbi:MAG: ACP S-malonyltransferase [Clostridium sp.]
MGKTAFIFPGQGAQVCGMGQDFYEHTETGRKIFDQASELLGFSMPELCFEKNDRLDIWKYTQAAMVTVSVAMLKVMEEQGFRPDVTAGLSLGEYCALAASGVMTPEDAITYGAPAGASSCRSARSCRDRGMDERRPGDEREAIDQVVDPIDGVQVANYNCPGQIVISGRLEAVAQAAEQLKAAGARRVLPLNVSGPFHSALLKEAGEKLGKFLENVKISDPVIPYAANVTAEYVTRAEEVKPLLERQVYSSVKWRQSVSGWDRRRRGPVRGDRPWKDPDRFCEKDQPGCEGR